MDNNWEDVKKLTEVPLFKLGKQASYTLYKDPIHLVFALARYKFVARLLSGKKKVLEMGCGDAFGSLVVADFVEKLYLTDTDEETIEENKERISSKFGNIQFGVWNAAEGAFKEKVQAVYLVDVLEHIPKEYEEKVFSNMCKTLEGPGICIVGTPNLTSAKYASAASKKGHINLKDKDTLKELMDKFFEEVFIFGMNDEVVHTGFPDMSHYLWALCIGRKERN